jgi:hypothetical protein
MKRRASQRLLTPGHPLRPLVGPLMLTASLLLSSCAPIARYVPAEGAGPVPPTALPAFPGSQEGVRIAAATRTPTLLPSPTAAATPTATAILPPTKTPTPTPTPAPIEPLTLDAARQCLAGGEELYALALQNTNVRESADTAACRIGRIPKGTLIRLTSVVADGAQVIAASGGAEGSEPGAGAPVSALSGAALSGAALSGAALAGDGAPDAGGPAEPAPPAAPVVPEPEPEAEPLLVEAEPIPGYVEDVQPIFVRTCNVCHSAVAQNKGLMVTTYEGVMNGSSSGPVVLPGDAEGSLLWQMLISKKMPIMGSLNNSELQTVRDWIDGGALVERPPMPTATPRPQPTAAPVLAAAATRPTPRVAAGAPDAAPNAAPNAAPAGSFWFTVEEADYDPVGDACAAPAAAPLAVVSSDLVLPVACGAAPQAAPLDTLRLAYALPIVAGGAAPVAAATAPDAAPEAAAAAAPAASSAADGATASELAANSAEATAADASPAEGNAAESPAESPAEVLPVRAAAPSLTGSATGISAPALGLAPPSDSDGWLIPRGGLCVQRFLPDNKRGITSMTFAPDGRLFLGLDSNLASEIDPLILYDAYHPSRSVGVLQPGRASFDEIFVESTRITGMDWADGALYLSRAGEVGRIPDGGVYEPLAGGFAVDSQLFHANNGLVISNGWLYISAGGIRDGYSDGPIVGVSEEGAQQMVSGGNPYAARIVRAPLDALLSTRSISAFSTAARGVRNPYGITTDGAGNIWFTDNGATNLPDDVSAGDEVNFLAAGAGGGVEASSPYYGFPLALTQQVEWYSKPAVTLVNTAAPTGIAWALGTIYFAQYGKDPGLYRIGVDDNGALMAERVLLGWPILALATAPDGALWMGTGDGGLFRLTTGCG